MWNVYILHCSDGSFYIGISSGIKKRVLRHNAGKGSKYTRARRPVELLYTEEFVTKAEARNREIEIKKYSVENKKKLIIFGLGWRSPSALELK